MKTPDTTAPRRRRAPVGLWLAVLVWFIACWPGLAEQGQDTSGLFTVDTRWGYSEGAAVSRLLTVDTRLSASTGADASSVFTVDTTGASVGNARIAGRVTDTLGAGLGSATVAALRNNVVRVQAGTDAGGYYQLNSLPAGTYQVRATKSNHLTNPRRDLVLVANQTGTADFALEPKPAVAELQTVIRPAETIVLRQVTGEQLKVFEGGQFVVGGWFDPFKPTVIMTHGWNSDPNIWALGMARDMRERGLANANILAWDWQGQDQAGTGPLLSKALSVTPWEGERLGKALAATFTPAYRQGVHFIGHSLGTLVNAEAANHLHQQWDGDRQWLREHTHVTLLDNAALANVEGTLVQLGYTQVGVQAPYEVGSEFTCGWVSPIPEDFRWMDNYVSLVGTYQPRAVNVWLPKAPQHLTGLRPFYEDLHGYAVRWYGYTTATPRLAMLGNRYSYEQLGTGASFPSSSLSPLDSLFSQDLASAGELPLGRIPGQHDIASLLAMNAANLGRFSLKQSLKFAAGVAQKVGAVALDVMESFIPNTPAGDTAVLSGIAGGTVAYYTDSGVQQQPEWSLQLDLPAPLRLPRRVTTAGGSEMRRQLQGMDDPASDAPRAWIPVAVPTNAALFSFAFTLTGDPGEDLLSASIAGTNVFLLEGRFMPPATLLTSGPIDVSQWAGQTVEFFFGFLGETASGAVVTVGGMRFYEVEPPRLTAELVAGGWLLSWPAAAEGYVLESAPTLSEPMGWSGVSEVPALVGMRNVLTNSVAGDARFYRLKR